MWPPCRKFGRSTKRCRNTTRRVCAFPTTSPCYGATTTGEPAPPANAGGTQAFWWCGSLLPLRLRGRSALLQMAQHHSYHQGVGADEPGLWIRSRPDLDRERWRSEADGVPHRILSDICLGPASLAERDDHGIHTPVGGT